MPWPPPRRSSSRPSKTPPTAPPSWRSSPKASPGPCASSEGKTVGARPAPVLVALLAACGGTSGPPAPASPRIDYVDGAVEPIVARGPAAVIEGFRVGATQSAGGGTLAAAGGGTLAPPLA